MNNENDDYNEVLKLQDLVCKRAFVSTAGKPFLVEPFCAQVSWMFKSCPVYPFLQAESKDVCRFLVDESYKDYRCPVCTDPDVIYKPIYEKGTEEQRKALETLADMSVRYYKKVPDSLKSEIMPSDLDIALSNAIRIYRGLGLVEKAQSARELWRETHTHFISVQDREETMKRYMEWEKRQKEIDRNSSKSLKDLLEAVK